MTTSSRAIGGRAVADRAVGSRAAPGGRAAAAASLVGGRTAGRSLCWTVAGLLMTKAHTVCLSGC